ncbi:hypothetical protein [Candidatus Carsonella ruddii]|uniref:Uncharacterized protein n=1 Tax=Carsonella ruddii TaxID=114186 RepID=A0A1U9RRC1_CARRU|nr:hypothetical protein [Candidatus Carsonella ruddii]AQU89450.1 hypothetical protein BW244_0032 [Candidatus Carsonella ruddii]
MKKKMKKLLIIKKEISISTLFFKNLILEVCNIVIFLIEKTFKNLKILFSVSFLKNLFLILKEKKNKIKQYIYLLTILLFILIINTVLCTINYYDLFKSKKKIFFKNNKILFLITKKSFFFLLENLYVLFSFIISFFLFCLNKFLILLYYKYIRFLFFFKKIKKNLNFIILYFLNVLLFIFNKIFSNIKFLLLLSEKKMCNFLINYFKNEFL